MVSGWLHQARLIRSLPSGESSFFGSRNFQVHINRQQLKQTENFVYLGGTISSNEGSENDVTRRIGLARGIFQNVVYQATTSR